MGVFISYSSKDKNFVERLSKKLVENRVGVWLDKWEMKPGDSLIDKIQNGLEDSSFLLVVLSNHYVQSEWCRKEQNSGLIKEINSKKVVVIPILLEDCPIPIFLQEKVYADFRGNFDDGFTELFRSLSIIANDHMGRFYNQGLTVDFAFNWGMLDDSFFVWLDFINFHNKTERTFLLQVEIEGNDVTTKRFEEHLKNNREWIMPEAVLLGLHEHPQLSSLEIRISNDLPYYNRVAIRDISSEQIFYVTIRGVLTGKDNGGDVLIHFSDYTTCLMEDRNERFSVYRK